MVKSKQISDTFDKKGTAAATAAYLRTQPAGCGATTQFCKTRLLATNERFLRGKGTEWEALRLDAFGRSQLGKSS